MNCKNLAEAAEKSGRYSRIIGNLNRRQSAVPLQQIQSHLTFTPPHAPKMSRHCFEAALSSNVHMMRTLTGVNLSPLEVTFIYPEPALTAEYERIFCCPVRFGQKENTMTMDMSIGNTPVLMGNRACWSISKKYAQDFLGRNGPQERTYPIL